MVKPDAQRVAVDVDIGVERRVQPSGQRLGGRRLRPGRRDDGEFVAAEARQEGALAGLLQAARDLAQQRIADGVAEHVVDRLEAVEIDAEHGEALARRRRDLDRGGDAFVERRPVRQIGERIVVRQVLDALLAGACARSGRGSC